VKTILLPHRKPLIQNRLNYIPYPSNTLQTPTTKIKKQIIKHFARDQQALINIQLGYAIFNYNAKIDEEIEKEEYLG
jgi:hypothetical protein